MARVSGWYKRWAQLWICGAIAGRADDVNSTDVALLRDAGDLLPDWYEDG
jgi:hypothetical protein